MNRRLLWSLLLAFILPLVQVGAAAHEISHVKSAPASIQCDQCTLGAGVTGGGAASTPIAIAVAQAPDTVPVAHVAPVASAQPFTAFSSRAPPSLP
jgi:hypothetical protein